ncbi:MAG: hypothetical protein ABIP29_11125 [Candidatus Eisenbacteria bacterium]
MRRSSPTAVAFAILHGRLVHRRLAGIDGMLRFELAALGALLGGYLALQARPLLEDLALRDGPWGAALGIEGAGLVLAALGGWLVAARHARRLRAPDGPAWLALPIDARDVASHLAWESKLQILWVVVPAVSVILAASGLLAVHWHGLLALGVAGFLFLAADLGTALGQQMAAQAVAPRPGMTKALRILTHVAPPRARPRLAAARWTGGPPWRALLAKDVRLAARLPALRGGLIVALAFAALSLLGWLLPTAPVPVAAGATAGGLDLRNMATFFVTLVAAALLAEWLVLVVGSDPFATLRALPLDVGDVWRARAAWGLGFTVLLLAGHALLAHGLALGPRLLFLSWVAGATLGLTILGVNYGLTLYPHTGAARRLLGLTLGLMAIVSTVLYLMGWVVLVAALIHTARRLPRWRRASGEEAA